MLADIALNQKRFLAALGNNEVRNSLGISLEKIVPLKINLETIQYWQRDFQWREWKKHLRAGGRIVCVTSALNVIRLAKEIYENETGGDVQFNEALLTVENWLNFPGKGKLQSVRELSESVKKFESKYKRIVSFNAQNALAPFEEIISIVEDENFTWWWRRAVWWTYISLTGLTFGADEFNRKQIFKAIRESVFDYYKVTSDDLPNAGLEK